MSYFETVVVLFIIAGLSGTLEQILCGFSPQRFLFSAPLAFVGAVMGYLLAVNSVVPILFPLDVGDRNIPLGWAMIIASVFAFIPCLIKYPQAKQGPIPPFEEEPRRKR